MSDIETIAKVARTVSFNAQIVAAQLATRGGNPVGAGVLSGISGQTDQLVRAAMSST